MAGKKYVFIIPGFRQQPTNKGYQEVKKLLRKEGFLPIPVVMSWNNKTVSENTEFFLRKYTQTLKKRDMQWNQVYVLGFSYGAMIAFLASVKTRFAGLILCSLSPYFLEDLPKSISANSSALQIKRHKDFSALKHSVLAKKIKAKKICMLYGTKEARPLIRRVTATFKHAPSSQKYLFSISKTHHDISQKNYLYTISHVAKEIL